MPEIVQNMNVDLSFNPTDGNLIQIIDYIFWI